VQGERNRRNGIAIGIRERDQGQGQGQGGIRNRDHGTGTGKPAREPGPATRTGKPPANRDRQATSEPGQASHSSEPGQASHQRTGTGKPPANRDRQATSEPGQASHSSEPGQASHSSEPGQASHQRTGTGKPPANRDRQATAANRDRQATEGDEISGAGGTSGGEPGQASHRGRRDQRSQRDIRREPSGKGRQARLGDSAEGERDRWNGTVGSGQASRGLTRVDETGKLDASDQKTRYPRAGRVDRSRMVWSQQNLTSPPTRCAFSTIRPKPS
jgi:hypothetical protein